MAEDRKEGTKGGGAAGRLGSLLPRRSLLGGAAVVLGGAALAACSTGGNASDQSGTAAGTTSLLKTIRDRGQLNVTTSLLYPPEFFKDKDGKPAGYDIDVLNMVAKDLNVKLNIIDVPDNAANIANVQSGKADLVEDYLAKPFVAQHPNVKLMNNGAGVATEFGCWGVLAGDYLWWRWLDNWISYNIDNAQLPGMYTNTFGLNWVHPS